MFKLLIIINKLNQPAICTEVIEFSFIEEANTAAKEIEKRTGDIIDLRVIKLYKH